MTWNIRNACSSWSWVSRVQYGWRYKLRSNCKVQSGITGNDQCLVWSEYHDHAVAALGNLGSIQQGPRNDGSENAGVRSSFPAARWNRKVLRGWRTRLPFPFTNQSRYVGWFLVDLVRGWEAGRDQHFWQSNIHMSFLAAVKPGWNPDKNIRRVNGTRECGPQ